MANNLQISYDLYVPGQSYDKVIAAIKELGGWAKIYKSFWYVNSSYSASQACDHVWRVMDSTDKIYVVDATNNVAAWQNLSDEAAKYIQDQWSK